MAKRKKRVVSKISEPMKLDAVRFGMAGGKLCALIVFIMTIVAIYSPNYAPNWTALILEIYGFMGYSISWLGAVLGLIYGFVDGFVFFGLLGAFYNRCRCCKRR